MFIVLLLCCEWYTINTYLNTIIKYYYLPKYYLTGSFEFNMQELSITLGDGLLSFRSLVEITYVCLVLLVQDTVGLCRSYYIVSTFILRKEMGHTS